MTWNYTGFSTGADVFMPPDDDVFSQPLPNDDMRWKEPVRWATSSAQEIKEFVNSLSCPTEEANLSIGNTEMAEPKNYFWNQTASNTNDISVVHSVEFQDEDKRSGSHRPVHSSPLQPAAKTLTIKVQHTLFSEEVGKGRPPKQRCRTNKKALYWTPDEHAKFVAGLEEFGLQKGLGPGGAAQMASYMGNRTVLQIKSHFQKYLADVAKGKSPSPGPARSETPQSP